MFVNSRIYKKELVDSKVTSYAHEKELEQRLRVYYNSSLTAEEIGYFNHYVKRLAPFSKYLPEKDNSKDRGEILSLSYMAAKNYIYFAGNDNLPARLIENAKLLNTGLDNLELLHTYDVIYYLYHTGKYDKKGLRIIYKYMYYLTAYEKKTNPCWEEFILQMDILYSDYQKNHQ